MKKVLSLAITFLLLISATAAVSAISFKDLPAEHWAHNNVMTLVNEGTVNGYEDGTFRPSKTVTRAEFVKMIGKWDRAYNGEIKDLSSSHWGYEYLIWSGLEPVNGNLYPDKEMLRSDVINLIWKRNGSPAHNGAPYAISKQGTNQSATSWAYTIGLLQGDDGFNLRLDSALSRAEAATLILRARTVAADNQKKNFKDSVSNELLLQVINSTDILEGKAYDPAKTLTNAEVARAAMVLSASGQSISYRGMDLLPEKLIQHKYANEMYVLSEKLWGASNNTVAFANKTATIQDTLSALVYGLVRRSGRTVNLKKMNTFYSDCVNATDTNMENLVLSYAADNGIKLTAGTTLGAQDSATMKDIAVLLLQIDVTAGLELSYDVSGAKYNANISKNMANYPQNYKDYHAIIEGVPSSVYNSKPQAAKPAAYYRTANKLSFVYTGFLNSVATKLRTEQGVNATFTYYPSLAYEYQNKVTFVAKCVLQGEEAKAADTVFAKLLKEGTGIKLVPGKVYYVIFETYEPLMDISLSTSDAYIKAIIIPN